MNKKYLTSNESEIRLSEREDAIRSLEERRLELTREAEELMREYSKITAKRALYNRSRAVGYAPNDYGFEKKRKKY